MTDPRCPTCRTELTFSHAIKMPDPWHYQCPECSTPLEAGVSHKIATFALPVAMLGVSGINLELVRTGVLVPLASLTLMTACALALFTVTVVIWQRTTFRRKTQRARLDRSS